jgi:Family of unknown function (DUF5677)
MLERAQQVSDTHSDARSALVLIHANSTMLVYEIRSLLLEGLWPGAAARWRALHELTVTAKLVAKGGPPMADRYLQHGFVTQTDRLARYFDAHGRGPVPEQELQRRQARAAELVATRTLPDQDGTFRDPYGWAAPLMPLGRKSGKRIRPSFDQLERIAELDQR